MNILVHIKHKKISEDTYTMLSWLYKGSKRSNFNVIK